MCLILLSRYLLLLLTENWSVASGWSNLKEKGFPLTATWLCIRQKVFVHVLICILLFSQPQESSHMFCNIVPCFLVSKSSSSASECGITTTPSQTTKPCSTSPASSCPPLRTLIRHIICTWWRASSKRSLTLIMYWLPNPLSCRGSRSLNSSTSWLRKSFFPKCVTLLCKVQQ